MTFCELIFLALSLSMDAFAAAVCRGLSAERRGIGEMCMTGAWFGGFQALMPVAGYITGAGLADKVSFIAPPLCFMMLTFIGANMIYEAKSANGGNTAGSLIVSAAAVSVDAFAAGVTLAFLRADIVKSAAVIGAVTFAVSAAGVGLGGMLGEKAQGKAALAGGGVLIILGVKILLGWLM